MLVVETALSQISVVAHGRESAPAVLPRHISSLKCCPLSLVFQVDGLESVYPSKFRMHCLSPALIPRAHSGVSWITDQPTDQPSKTTYQEAESFLRSDIPRILCSVTCAFH